jgi:23S rRNA (cytidine1920-2'-O)/16S rRNA (cytidine1409-2'-O)-methyltransferase
MDFKPGENPYVTRGGLKLEYAIEELGVDVCGLTAADFGCHIGGFTHCLLELGAQKVYAVDTGYGILDWGLRVQPAVEVLERTNAMHVELPEKVDVITSDVGWTRQRYILPSALKNIKPDGIILSLFKPQYEADDDYVHEGVVSEEDFDGVLERALEELEEMGIHVAEKVKLPHPRKTKNPEAILLIRPGDCNLEPGAVPGGAQ